MVFNKEFDKSLWYMLEADSENRNDIINFLNTLPNDLKTKIVETIKYADNEFDKGNKDFEFEDEYNYANNGFAYSFEIDNNWDEKNLVIKQQTIDPSELGCDGVSFSKELWIWGIIQEYPDDEDIIGNFSYSVNLISKQTKIKTGFMPYIAFGNGKVKHIGQMKEKEYEYSLSKSKDIIVINKIMQAGKPTMIKVNLEEMPEDLTMEYINNRYLDSKDRPYFKSKQN